MSTLTLDLDLDADPVADVVAAAERRRAAHAALVRAQADTRAAERRAADARARFHAATSDLSTAATAARRRGLTAGALGRAVGLSRQRIAQLTA